METGSPKSRRRVYEEILLAQLFFGERSLPKTDRFTERTRRLAEKNER